jgi:hypothetical protein
MIIFSKNANIFGKNFGENIFKIITSVPDPEAETLTTISRRQAVLGKKRL